MRTIQNRLSPEEIQRWGQMLESGVSQRRDDGILYVSRAWYPKCRLVILPSEIIETKMAEVETELRLNVRTDFVKSQRQRFLNTTRLNKECRNRNRVRISTLTVIYREHEF